MLPTQPTPQKWANHNAVRRVAIWMAVAGVTISLLAVSRSLAPPPTNPRPTRPWSDRCVGVADGDTISVMHHGVEVRVRLNAVDCPERRQAFGKVAKRFASDLVFGKIVTVRPTDTDRYGRTVGDVLTADGRSLNEELVAAGPGVVVSALRPRQHATAGTATRGPASEAGAVGRPEPGTALAVPTGEAITGPADREDHHTGERLMPKYGGFSWKRLLGISAAKSRISRATGIPWTRSGRQRKIGGMCCGCLVPVIVALMAAGVALAVMR